MLNFAREIMNKHLNTIKMSELNTRAFIDKYLVPGGTGKGFGCFRMVADSRGTDWRSIIGKIRRMEYHDFLATRYWNLIALQVKSDSGWRCAKCGRRSGLVVHHMDYACLGTELFHLEKLVCLCRECHEELHGLRRKK